MKRLSTLSIWIMLALVAFSTTSCDPIVRVSKILLGDWEVRSFTEDGAELMNSLISTFTIEFEEYQETDGDFSWTWITSTGETIVLSGDYELKNEGTEIELTFKSGSLSGEVWTLDLTVDDTDLEMSGNADGFLYNIEARKD